MSVIARNRKATRDFVLHERFEAGVSLQGWEVKGIMADNVQLADCHVILRRGEAWLLNCDVKPQANVDAKKVDPRRTRKLLLKSGELSKLVGKSKQTGLAIVVLDLHRKNGKIKAEIALAKGKKLHDKRRSIKEREWQRSKGR